MTLTEQEALQYLFDRSATHLMEQEQESRADPWSRCLYAGPWGFACAVGCLMTREQAEEADQRLLCVQEILRQKLLDEDALTAADAASGRAQNLLSDLQTLHDVYSPNTWLHALVNLSDKYNLELDALVTYAP